MNPQVLCGINNLHLSHTLKGARLGLITNPTGVDSRLRPTIDILSEGYHLACLMSPEHGVRGDAQAGEKVDRYTDEETGLPVYSLYDQSHRIPSEAMDAIDVVVFDIQDVGARYYTYLYTLAYAMEDCARAGKTLTVLDRPNPISCKPRGAVLQPGFASFVGRFPIAAGYGMTIGEYARYINGCYGIGCRLEVVPMTDWNPAFYYEQTGLLWVAPSPNLPTVDSCLCYIGTCLFEGTNISEGRGTTKPFEIIGAPWLNAQKVMHEMERHRPRGLLLREAYFRPAFSKHAGLLCQGLQLYITSREDFEPFEAGVLLLDAIRHTHREFEFLPPSKEGDPPFIDLLLGSDAIRQSGFCPQKFFCRQRAELEEYNRSIESFRLY
ncbi:MAG: DUF1343 domain-containing protein [Clostridiaceae bacterium]|nr:DUF1343 domain-containing protein [Clostridiaceae bacterium]